MEIGFLLVALYVLGYILTAVQGWIMSTMTQKVSRELRTDISRKINRLPMWYYNRTTTGDVLSRVTNDVDTIGQSLNQSIGNLISSVVLFFGSLIMMLITDGWMTLTAVVLSLFGFAIMFSIMGRSQKYFTRQQKHLGELNGHIEEIYAGHTVVKAYNGEADAQKAFDRMNRNLCDSGFKAQGLAGLMMPIMGFIGNLGYVAICVVGGAMAQDGKISFGVIVAFMMYVRYFTQPLSQIAQAVQSLQSAGAAGERVFEFLEAEEMEDESTKLSNVKPAKGEVEFKHVRFGYDTILNVQVNLSQGQKQQLTIARAMIADKPMLILDEATSSVDTRTEQQIQTAMDKLMENRTSFVIAHRLSTIKNADLILVLKDGDIIESGNHEELLRQNGFYADLSNSQFEQAS